MKLLIDLTQDELVTLTPEQKQQVYLLELAERGIALPSAVPAYMDSPEERDDLKPDINLYVISSGYSNEYTFETIEAAKEAAEVLTRLAISTDYDYRNSTKYYRIKSRDIGEVDIKTLPAYSLDRYDKLKDELKQYGDQKEKIERNNRRRTEITDKQAQVMTEIDDAILEAERNVTRINEFAGMFAEYLKMAENNHQVAVRFLLNAHYDEIAKYEPEYLERIGITKQDVTDYEASSAKKDEE